MDAVLDRNTKSKVANQLASGVLANDDEIRAQRATWNAPQEKLTSQTSGWNAQSNMKKVENFGGVDAYKQKQN